MLSNKTRMAFMHTFLRLKLGYLPFAFMLVVHVHNVFAKVVSYACKIIELTRLIISFLGCMMAFIF
jgi:hypothetical protein